LRRGRAQYRPVHFASHTTIQRDVDAVATSSNITPQPPPLADSLEKRMRAQRDSLMKLSGADFDRAYVASQIAAHREALDVLNRLASAAQNPQLRNTIQQAIPKVQSHLDRAQALQRQLGGRSP
jgi:putative membrane protein